MRPAAVVTGGASGIGLAIAERLLDDGWPVALVDTDADALGEAEDRFAGENAVFLAADITDEDEVAEALDTAVDALGPFGGLVNTIGPAREMRFEQTSPELFRQMVDVSLVGVFIACQAALERMGDALSVVNLIPASGVRANAGRTGESAAAAGVKMLTETMAVELGPRGVRVNCVACGPVDMPSVLRHHEASDSREWLERVPQGRLAAPEEIASAVAFLLSREAGYVNGHTLAVDGGFSMAGILSGRF